LCSFGDDEEEEEGEAGGEEGGDCSKTRREVREGTGGGRALR